MEVRSNRICSSVLTLAFYIIQFCFVATAVVVVVVVVVFSSTHPVKVSA